ncbi:hypothetical protein PTKIN_Ptkin03bG0103700 [Pterospermum kingtungense]
MSCEKEPCSAIKKPKTTLQPCVIKQESPTKPQQPPNASSINDAINASSATDALATLEVWKKKDSPIDNHEKENKNNDDDDDDNYLDSFPPGYRFCPLDEELVLYYLKKRVLNEPLPQNRIMEVNLYRHNPEKLAEQYKQYGEKEWYFFTPRDKKYRNGTRPNRAAGDGYWKATGADKEVKFKDQVVGYRKALVFYRGKPPKGDKTNWIMHEYRVNDPPPCKRIYSDMRLDDWVLCRIYKKVDKSIRTRPKDEYASSLIHNEETSDQFEVLDFNYNSVADSMDYPNSIGSFMHQSFSDESYTANFQHSNISNHFPVSLSSNFGSTHSKIVDHSQSIPIRGGQDHDIWNVANLDFASQLDFYGVSYVEPLVNLDNILSFDTSNKDSSDSTNERG